jgi:hypothetical protein
MAVFKQIKIATFEEHIRESDWGLWHLLYTASFKKILEINSVGIAWEYLKE